MKMGITRIINTFHNKNVRTTYENGSRSREKEEKKKKKNKENFETRNGRRKRMEDMQ